MSLELQQSDGAKSDLSGKGGDDFFDFEEVGHETFGSHVRNVCYTTPTHTPLPAASSNFPLCNEEVLSHNNTRGHSIQQTSLASRTCCRRCSCIVLLAAIFIAASFLLSCASLSFAAVVFVRQQDTTAKRQQRRGLGDDNVKTESEIENLESSLSQALTRLEILETGLDTLRSSQQVDLNGSCHEDVSSCTVRAQDNVSQWYNYSTNLRLINIHVSHIASYTSAERF